LHVTFFTSHGSKPGKPLLRNCQHQSPRWLETTLRGPAFEQEPIWAGNSTFYKHPIFFFTSILSFSETNYVA
jgi:hypothetical protein